MAGKLQRPILWGGLGIAFTLWLLESWYDTLIEFGEYGLLSALAIGGCLWLFKQKQPKNNLVQLEEIPKNRSTVEKAIAKTETLITQLAQEYSEETSNVSILLDKAAQLYFDLDRQELKLAVTGGKSVGKTTLIQQLQENKVALPTNPLQFQETAPLFIEAKDLSDAEVIKEAATADYILFLTNGDLTDTEYQTIQQIKTENQRLMLVLNKQDQYLPEERASVLLSLKQRQLANVVATSASPLPIKVRKHHPDGSTEEWLEQPAADIQQLAQQIQAISAQQAQQLVWATTMRNARLLKTEVQDLLNGVRRDRAVPVIEQYQWIAAAAAFANPVPALDLLATAAINAQMIMDLGNIYQHPFSLDRAKTVAGEMGGLMLKLGLVELSTKAISTVLKTNAVTYIAGGAVQGVSAAYLTRLAGLSLIEYMQQQDVTVNSANGLNLEKLGQVVQKVFQQNQGMVFVQSFVSQSVKRLLPEAADGELVAAQKAA